MTESLTRHQIRIKAFQMLFALNANPDADQEQLYQQLLSSNDIDVVAVPDYLRELVEGVLADQTALDAKISQYLMSGWTLGRIAKTDLIILQIAFFELDHEHDIPRRAVVNEALELAKQFSDDRSRRFVNGVLSHELDKNN
ncbi:transcription antitermination factor NusB [Secundilactobacillus kimchicus]|uniref:Transcription antitermination protein NusB n=1 Tax=Secundilactobacillus kimchicus JCM 15530 TaxID=1302272 RepID=A0A0R1HS49_9LACO|nr:transcription antitermination factor NusB [Secundilactobacillus kimchicus]KRK49270.1 transcription antitermination protein NusB [Secundilactobacillus kimchicus JCM 15530]